MAVSTEQFAKLNSKIPLYPDKMNSWLFVVRTIYDGDTTVSRAKATAQLKNWLASEYEEGELPPFTEVRATGIWPFGNVLPVSQGRVTIEPWPVNLTDSSELSLVSVEFLHSTKTDSVPWPWESSSSNWQDVDVGVVAYYSPFQHVELPDYSPLDDTVDQLADEAKETLKNAPLYIAGAVLLGVLIAKVVK